MSIFIGRENENIVAIKEASGNIEQVKKICESGVIDVYSGNDDQIYDVMDAGGIGVISVLANIFPKETHQIVKEYMKGNKEKSLKMQRDALEVVKALFSEKNPMPVKKAVELEGLCNGYLREPLIELDSEKTLKLVQAIDEYKKRRD